MEKMVRSGNSCSKNQILILKHKKGKTKFIKFGILRSQFLSKIVKMCDIRTKSHHYKVFP